MISAIKILIQVCTSHTAFNLLVTKTKEVLSPAEVALTVKELSGGHCPMCLDMGTVGKTDKPCPCCRRAHSLNLETRVKRYRLVNETAIQILESFNIKGGDPIKDP